MTKEKKDKGKLFHYANGPSLEEINNTVAVPKNAGFFKMLLAYSGPGALVAVGYMDPGNWITSIAGGAEHKYILLSVILFSSLIAMLLQSMAAKLGIVTGHDLAQATRAHTSKKLGFVLWIITELAIMATDIAEIIGGAVALELLFGFPLLLGVLITAFDVLLLLFLTKLGFRKIEVIVVSLITIVFFVFAYEVILANPNIKELFMGFIPNTKIATNQSTLFLALGIVGATVMPHNLYLHSSISQARMFDRKNEQEIAKAIRFTIWDSNLQLFLAFIVNCLLLILGAALFYGKNSELGKFVDLYDALKNPSIVGKIASPFLSMLFAIALLASGQNSTITGTLSGQIVMEGFIHLKMPLWMRRVMTRLLAIIPVIICVIIYGNKESAVEDLLLYTQVFLSIALPISIIPLTIYTSDKKLMGRFVNPLWVSILAWIITIILTILNLFLVYQTLF
ncbi:Nramp family divalent metal transporter [Melissococcus plutonius]|uniref:Divalent metal cation transporter MntH n=1 Tax=Melissococcus plutonius (strain ATCC 35311 / DSM 29964 / CIP 104052 / LMG 20360 / NCIMB 702443) TaxID=940190 RepID=F3YAG1_MELPT|nr:Nramp family divalent metal transporter [Melissococcus plutonius]KMT40795.1 divalent metal cation transporter MntH [Melissococcus plutonius]MBB5176747.1 manganese transport protein [Melissococcus plutonius]BAK21489.1 manganese transport protein MntH [Melissococcus plutonius ATCC 35311]BBD15279.1 manganese transport protein MntH [Melissococcus plutonius]